MTKLGREPVVGQNCRLQNCRFGIYTEIGADNYLENVHLDDYSYTGPWSIIQNTQIGKFSNLAAALRIGPTDHPMDRASLHHFTYRRRMYGFREEDDRDFFKKRVSRITSLGHDTWVGHGVIIMPEVTVGTGAVIGAGAIVTKDIPPYTIAVGSPARVIKDRFSPEIAADLMRIAWWDWTYQKIDAHLEDFSLPISQFVSKHLTSSDEGEIDD